MRAKIIFTLALLLITADVSAQTIHEACSDLKRGATAIMTARQNYMSKANAIAFSKTNDSLVNQIIRDMVDDAWAEPVQVDNIERKVAVGRFGAKIYNECVVLFKSGALK